MILHHLVVVVVSGEILSLPDASKFLAKCANPHSSKKMVLASFVFFPQMISYLRSSAVVTPATMSLETALLV